MGELKPLRDDLPPAARQLADEMRDLLRVLGITLNRYAARKYLDHGSVSRFLSGERIPPWNFVHDLLVEATEHRDGVPPTQPVVEHLMRLRLSALEAGGSPSHQVQLLQDRLHDADREASRAAARERELREALQAAQHRAAELLVSEREARALVDVERDGHHTELALYEHDLTAERASGAALAGRIQALEEELRIAHQRLIVAERRCGELERQLEHALRDEAQQPQRLAGRTWAEGDDPRAAKTAQQAAAALEKMNPTHAAGSLAAMAPAAAAAALSAMAPANAAAALQIMDPASSASVFGVMRTASALRYLDAMDPRRVPPVMDVISPEPAAVILDALSREGAADALAAVSSQQAARLVGKMNPVRATDALSAMSPEHAGRILVHEDRERADAILTALPTESAAAALNHMGFDGIEVLLDMDEHHAARLIAAMAPDRAAEGLRLLQAEYAAQLLILLEPMPAARILQEIDPDRAFSILLEVEPDHALRLFTAMEPDKAESMRRRVLRERIIGAGPNHPVFDRLFGNR
jgi:flagellar motility protein MotE (MotC chaperone)